MISCQTLARWEHRDPQLTDIYIHDNYILGWQTYFVITDYFRHHGQ